MRTATTLGRTKDGWKLVAGPDVPADKQRKRFNDAGAEWPVGILELRFQTNDGSAKSRTKEKAESINAQTENAAKRADAKVELAKKREEEAKKAAEVEATNKKKAEAEQRARELKAKAEAKAK